MSGERRAVILQSNYIPWKGYFDLMHKADVFVIYDSVQYTKRDWRNRNKVRTTDGTTWLTIPVETKGRYHQAVDEVRVSDLSWAETHWSKIESSLAAAACFERYRDGWRTLFEEAGELTALYEINELFLRSLATTLGITTEIVRDREVGLSEGTSSERLAELSLKVGATSYLTGPAGLDYLEQSAFENVGVSLEVIDYSPYVHYPQSFPGFEAGVTVLDLLANVGNSSLEHLVGSVSVPELA